MTRTWMFTTLSVALAACTTHGMSGSAAMEGHLAAAEEELARHHGTVMQATSLLDVTEEAGTHESNMGRVMGGMDDSMGGMMSHCSGSGMNRMRQMMTAMQSEMHDHASALENAADLATAHTACEAHVAEMDEMLSSMHEALGRVDCPMMDR